MACKKCGGEKLKLRQDKRGLPEFICADCESYIKKAGATEVYEFFASFNLADEERKAPEPEPVPDRAPCRYCTENWAYTFGRLGSQVRHVDAVFCPMCGRKLQPSDRQY